MTPACADAPPPCRSSATSIWTLRQARWSASPPRPRPARRRRSCVRRLAASRSRVRHLVRRTSAPRRQRTSGGHRVGRRPAVSVRVSHHPRGRRVRRHRPRPPLRDSAQRESAMRSSALGLRQSPIVVLTSCTAKRVGEPCRSPAHSLARPRLVPNRRFRARTATLTPPHSCWHCSAAWRETARE